MDTGVGWSGKIGRDRQFAPVSRGQYHRNLHTILLESTKTPHKDIVYPEAVQGNTKGLIIYFSNTIKLTLEFRFHLEQTIPED